MADYLQDFLRKVGQKIVAGLYTDLIAKNLVTSGQPTDSDWADVNQEVGFKVKPTYTATLWAKGESAPSATAILPEVAKLKLDKVIRCPLSINNLDLKNLPSSLPDEEIQAAVDAIALAADRYVIDNLKLSKNYSALASTPATADVIAWRKALNTRKAPKSNRKALLDPETAARVMNIANLLQASQRGNGNTILTGEIGTALGCQFFESNNANEKITPGDASLVVNNKGTAYAVGATTIAFDGGSSSDLQAGDMVKFGAGTVYYTVQTVTFTTPATAGSFTCNPLTAADAALAVDDAAIAVVRPSESFMVSPECGILGVAPLRPYLSAPSVTIQSEFGSVRVSFSDDTGTMVETIQVDMLVGFKMFNYDYVQKIVDLT